MWWLVGLTWGFGGLVGFVAGCTAIGVCGGLVWWFGLSGGWAGWWPSWGLVPGWLSGWGVYWGIGGCG